MGRQLPVECEHGRTVDGGDFARTERCPECENVVIGRLIGRQTHANGDEYVSFRLVAGTVEGGPDGIGRHYVLVATGEPS